MTDSEQVMEWAKTQGVVVCNEPKERQRLLDYIVPVAAVFPDLVKQVNATYVYRMEEQKKKAAGADGMLWKDVAGKKGTLYAIGISVEAMDGGPEYAAFVFMHELAHMVTDVSHTSAFHEKLSEMIATYNQTTGTNIVNDFYDWPSRFDSRPYILPDNIRVEPGCKSTAFRTEAKE